MSVSTTHDFRATEDRLSAGVYAKRSLTLVRGAGALVWDDEGRQYIDCGAGYGVLNVGHCHPAVVEAVQQQAATMIACPEMFHNDQRAMLMEELAAVLPTGMSRIFLCNSGTEGTEAALKFARATTGRSEVVATMRGFHGRTMGALSATWEPHYRDPFGPLVPGFRHVAYNNLAALEEAVGPQTAAVIVEVVQGEGGVRPGTEAFLRGAEAVCRRHGAMLIVDEVQTGFGRTGRLWAVDHFGIRPDLLVLAKSIAGGFPMGAVAIGERVGALGSGIHGSTFGGNPLACAAARATLRVVVDGGLPAQAATKGAWLLNELRQIKSQRIREVRGLGLMVGLEMRERVAPLVQALQARGVIVLNAGPSVIRLLPPLMISDNELQTAVAAIAEVVA
ncbi:MAG: aspartate aminotransferase family protein [Herpetosiphon sp.]